MNKIFKIVGVFLVLCLASMVWADPYRSLNKICVVEKRVDGYWFLNGKELSAKAEQVFGSQRDQFEWFFTEDEKIQAKVYPALRDAMINTPDDLYRQTISDCALTDVNKKLASQVSFTYRSKDQVCACLLERNRINCAINEKQLAQAPYEQWALFFETGGFPSVISGVVPPDLFKAWINLPDDYIQAISPCSNNTSNEELVKQLEKKVRSLKQ